MSDKNTEVKAKIVRYDWTSPLLSAPLVDTGKFMEKLNELVVQRFDVVCLSVNFNAIRSELIGIAWSACVHADVWISAEGETTVLDCIDRAHSEAIA